jgi:3-oxoacyl-[acyl-carrier-protein] synthase III
VRWDDIYIAGVGVYLPEQEQTAEQAVAAGLYDAAAAETNGIRAVRVAGDDEPGAVMAARAGQRALEHSGLDPADVDLVLHAYVAHQGRDMWSPASFVQAETGCTSASGAIEVRQGSNSAFAAMELAAGYLAARPSAKAALITSGDAFRLPYIDRWKSDDQTVFGDGASAAVLSKGGGFAKLIATSSVTEPSLEPLYRGSEPWTKAPFEDGKPVNLTARKDDWLMRHEDAYDDAIKLVGDRFSQALNQALAEADMTIKDADWVVHATLIKPLAEWGFHKLLDLDVAKTTYEWGLDYGHMGTCDQFAGLDHLVRSGRPKPGDRLVTWAAGLGFMWTVAVLEFVEPPAAA